MCHQPRLHEFVCFYLPILAIEAAVVVRAAEPPVVLPGDVELAADRAIPPDTDALAAIARLKNSTPAEVDRYVAEIIEVSSRTHHVWDTDPQPQMLCDIGPNNIAFLFEAMGKQQGAANAHLEKAIRLLVRDSHRELLRKYLPFHPRLASIVVSRGWQRDFQDVLIEGLNQSRYLSPEWFQAVARLDDPRLSEALRRYMETGDDPVSAYQALKARKDPGIDQAVLETWRAIALARPYVQDVFAPIAAKHGVIDALTYIARAIETPTKRYFLEMHERTIRDLLRYEGTPSELAALVLEDVDRLTFDPQTQRYVLHR